MVLILYVPIKENYVPMLIQNSQSCARIFIKSFIRTHAELDIRS